MTDAFSEREKGFERKFELDQDVQFRIQARRDRLLGMWIAAKLGKTGGDAEDYAKEVVASNFERPGDGDMIGKVVADLKDRAIPVTEVEIARKLAEFHVQAEQQIKGEAK